MLATIDRLLHSGRYMTPTISIAFRAPAQDLLPFISTYYEFTVAGHDSVEDYLHPEWGNIRMALDKPWIIGMDPRGQPIHSGVPSILQGPTSKPTYIKGSGTSFGIGILPSGWSRLWDIDASSLADRIVPLATVLDDPESSAFIRDIYGAAGIDARKAIADRFLLQRVGRSKPLPSSPKVEMLLSLLADPENASVEQLTDRLGMTQSQLARLCKRTLGFTPKLLLRRQRFLRMLGTMHARPYGEWRDFIDPQYTDQSHLVRDFQFFLGMSPRTYFNLPRPILNAAARARTAMFGQPLQGLHNAVDKTSISSKT